VYDSLPAIHEGAGSVQNLLTALELREMVILGCPTQVCEDLDQARIIRHRQKLIVEINIGDFCLDSRLAG
jgi:hypothetical protein